MKCESNTAVILIHVLNFFDGLLTLYAVSLGVLEVNPLMRWALGLGPLWFLFVKVGVVSTGLYFLDKQLEGSKRKIFLLLLAAYALVIAWHVFGVLLLYNLLPPSTPQAVGILMGKGYEF